MSAKESSSSSSSSHSSPSSSPETPKKVQKSPSGTPEASKVPKSPTSSPETPKKVQKTPASSPETPKKVQKTPASSPEAPKKVQKTPTSSPETPKKVQKTPAPKKVQKTPASSPEAPKKVQKTPTSSPETPKKVQKTPTGSPKASKVSRSPTSSPETPRKVQKTPTSSPEALKKVQKSPTGSPEAAKSPTGSREAPKKLQKSLLSFPQTPKEDDRSPTGKPKVTPKRLPDNNMFTSSLQVFLKQKQDVELEKNIEYKDKLEKGEIDEEDECKGEEEEEKGREGRRGSEDGGIDKEQKERTKKEGMRQNLIKKEDDKDLEEETVKNAKPTKIKKKGEESDTSKTKESKAKTEEKRKIEKEREKAGKKKEKIEKKEDYQEERKNLAEEKEKETPREKRVKVTEKKEEKSKKEGEKSEARVTETKREVKKEEKAKEGSKKEEVQEEEKEKRKREESREANEDKKEEEEEEEKRKKKGVTKDERALGHLYLKRKRTFSPWKEYYFVLDGLLLTYYRSQQDYERLSSMKGSIDLSLVEEVHPRKAGLMKTHHPFCLSRRNRPSVHLAADTKEEQERWMSVLQAALGPRMLSFHSSDKTLNADTASASCVPKSSTLPARVKKISCSSSVTDDEDEEGEKKKEEEEEEEEKEEEEEPLLIKPKKVTKIPIGMPLVKVDLGQVKLKKVEKIEVNRKDVEEGKAADVSSSPTSTREDPKQEGQAREASPAELFGVVLKKTKNKEELEEKESSGEAGGALDGSVSPGNISGTSRRPSKQPVIPFNSRKLLVVSDVKEAKSPRVSPSTQKRATPERKKSPSPSLPISKSVQALTKSFEEVRATQVDSTSSTEGKDGDAGVKICHARTSELKYSDVEDIVDAEEVPETVAMAEEEKEETARGEEQKKKETAEKTQVMEGSKQQIQVKEETVENKEEAVKKDEGQKPMEDEAVKKVPPDMHLKVDEDEDEENKEVVHADFNANLTEETPREETLNEDFINNNSQQVEAAAEEHKHGGSWSVEDKSGGGTGAPHPDSFPESSRVTTPLTPPTSPASSVTSSDSEAIPKASLSSPPSSDPVPPSPKQAPPSPKQAPPSPKAHPLSPGASGDNRDLDQEIHSNVQAEKLKMEEEHVEEMEMVLSDSPRDRAGTNESTASSCPEGGEKKPGKFKLLKSKLKVGGSVKEKKEDSAVQKEPKEKKRRGSNTFSNFLPGKKTKEGSKKPTEDESQPSQVEDTGRPRVSSHHEVTPPSESPPTEAKALPTPVVPEVDVKVTPPPVPQPSDVPEPSEEDPQAQVDAFLASFGRADDGLVTLRTTETYSKARDSTYSHTSSGSRDDPPPSIPEKTYMRARSPNHDVPQNNRPVTNLQLMDPEDENEDEDENSHTLDGYITEEQIEALLNAKENREKKKRSKSRSQLYTQPDVVKGTPLTSVATEDWAIKRPSYTSFSSIDSDEPLPTTNFLSFERRSSSSGSIKALNRTDGGERSSLSFSESGDSLSPEVESPAEPVRRAPRATDGITAKNRKSLTSPEFTVKEEEGLSSPETPKARTTRGDGDGDEEQHDDDMNEPHAEAEQKDFFPVVGGDVHLRQPASLNLPSSDLRTSGIVSLKEYLKAQEEGDLPDVKSGISRLGHSAAVEKLKQTTSEQ